MDIARVIHEAATDESPRLRYLAGKDAIAMAAHRAGISDEEHLAQSVMRFGLQG